MNCMYCGIALRKFADARLVTRNGEKLTACRDVDACNARKKNNG
jgi:alpha-D-ribose 1-methylphosphonate 5-phosphate C-P lyase